MVLPQTYPLPAETAVASYSYTDIAEGTGLQIFYGAHSKQTTNDTYLLLGSVIASNDIELLNLNLSAQGSATLLWDLDFDTSPFNLPKTIKGTAYVSVPIHIRQGGTSVSAYIIAKLRRVPVVGAEVEIANAQSETLVGVATDVQKKLLVKITVPSTHFKKGETLRLTIEVWYTSEAANNELGIAFDPKGRVGTEFPGTGDYKVTTVLEAHIPFRLDL